MKRARLGIAFAVVFLALPVAANAPTQPPSERQYADFLGDSQRITDNFTDLVWERSVSGLVDFNAARNFCNRGTNPPTRVPTMKELLTLVDEEPNKTYDQDLGREVFKHIDLNAFDDGPSGLRRSPIDAPYWTSSLDTNGRVFTVNFADGTTLTDPATAQNHVRCVQALP